MAQTVNLQPHQQRVVEEYKELKDKIQKSKKIIKLLHQ